MFTPRIIYKPGFTVVGFACDGVPTDGHKDALWEQLGERYTEIPHVDPDTGFGVCAWSESNRRYLAGLAVRRSGDVPPGMETLTLPTHVYAVFTHRGLSGSLDVTVKAIYDDWLPASGYEQNGEFYFEYYDDRFQPNSRDSIIFIWIPIKGD